MSTHCFKCKNKINLDPQEKISFREECPHCLVSIHICLMCEFYDSNSYNDCSEPQAERVIDKEKANFCDYFALNRSCFGSNDNRQNLLEKANSLFKK